jgi:phage shock protein A
VTPNEHVANLLAEVKLAEKKLARAQEKLAPVADRIKAALRAGDRPAAEKLALHYEQAKDEVGAAESAVAQAKEAYEAGKKQAGQTKATIKAIQQAQALGTPLGAMNAAFDKAKDADDMAKKLEEEAALAEAKLDLLLDEAEAKLPPELRGTGAPKPPPPPPPNTAEDILKEFE